MKKHLFIILTILILLSSQQETIAQWEQCEGFYGGDVNSVAASENILLAATYNGIFSSSDSGINWTRLTPEYDSYTAVAIFGNIFLAGRYKTSLYSTNSGANWNNTIIGDGEVHSFAKLGNILFAATGTGVYRSLGSGSVWTRMSLSVSVFSITASGTDLFAGTSSSGVYKSTNNGINWMQTSLNNGFVSCLESSGDNIYAGTNHGIYLSTDNGLNWNLLFSQPVNSIAVSGNNIFADSFLSTDNGVSWTNTDLGEYINELAVSGNTVFAGVRENGIYSTPDNGSNWSQLPWGNQSASCLTFSGNNIYAGTKSRVYRSDDNGLNWIRTSFNVQDIYSLAAYGSTILVSTNTGVYKSDNYGSNWIQSGLSDRKVLSLLVRGYEIFAGTDSHGLYRSTNNGSNWVNYNLSNCTVPVLATSGGRVFAGTAQDTIYYSDNGTDWTMVFYFIWSISSMAVSNNRVFIGSSYPVPWTPSIYRSLNNGITWDQMFPSANPPIYCLAASGDNLIVGKYGGVYLSTNNGGSFGFVAKNQGFNTVPPIEALLIANDYVFAGTLGQAVWRRSMNEIIIGINNISFAIPEDFNLNQNYPNPFNPMTIIRYDVRTSSNIALKIFDITGREVETLLNEKQSPGTYEVTFDASLLPSGVYFYTLEAEKFSDTKKMVLLK